MKSEERRAQVARLSAEVDAIVASLGEGERRLLEFVRKHERRNDWGSLQAGAGRPSPRLRIMEYVAAEVVVNGDAGSEVHR